MADQLLTGTTLIEDKRRTDFGLIWSCTGSDFTTITPDVDDVNYGNNSITANADGITIKGGNVHLPNGSVVTSVTMYGNAGASAETWTLARKTLATGTEADLATAAINTEDTSISNATIDNSNYSYSFSTTTIDTGDSIYGAKIVYT